MRSTTLALATLLALAGAAAGQDPRLASLEGAARAAVVAQMDSARADGLPTEPLVQKALEGLSKGARGDRIVAAVRGLRLRLGVAADALGGDADEAALVAGAAALYAGAEPGTLTELAAARHDASLAMALVVLADLVERGVPANDASSAIVSLARAGVDAAGFSAFRTRVEHDIDAGAEPAASTALRLRGLLLSRPPPPPRSPGEGDRVPPPGPTP